MFDGVQPDGIPRGGEYIASLEAQIAHLQARLQLTSTTYVS